MKYEVLSSFLYHFYCTNYLYQMHWTKQLKVNKQKLMQSFLVFLYIPQNTSDNSNHENTVY